MLRVRAPYVKRKGLYPAEIGGDDMEMVTMYLITFMADHDESCFYHACDTEDEAWEEMDKMERLTKGSVIGICMKPIKVKKGTENDYRCW